MALVELSCVIQKLPFLLQTLIHCARFYALTFAYKFLEAQKSLCKPGPDLVVCDEGHRIKNSQANISQALKKIHTRYNEIINMGRYREGSLELVMKLSKYDLQFVFPPLMILESIRSFAVSQRCFTCYYLLALCHKHLVVTCMYVFVDGG